MSDVETIDRRAFLREGAAGALLLLVTTTGCRPIADAWASATGRLQAKGEDAFTPVAYLRIDPSGDVTIIAHRSEMGQGSKTSLAMALADELDADWTRVRVVQAPGDEKTYGNQNTDGSSSIRRFLLPMRRAGATARAILESAAASQWGVPVTDVRADLHRVRHIGTGRTVSYGELVLTARNLPVPDESTVRLKSSGELRYIGKDVPIVDLRDMTTGHAIYGADHRLPNMLVAMVARPLVYGGTVGTIDSQKAEQVPGVVRVVRLDPTPPPSAMLPMGGVAVVATSTWAALQGRRALQVTWTDGPNATYDSRAYREVQRTAARQSGTLVRTQGDVRSGLASAAHRLEADYYVPHLSHAPMEPPAALAWVHDGRCEVWAPTQDPQGARNAVATALAIGADAVRVNVTLLGGAFGRKSFHDFIIEAALISRAVERPVRVQWTREDDIQHDFFHPPGLEHLEGGIDASGRLVAWLHRSVIPSLASMQKPGPLVQAGFEVAMGMADFPYQVPHLRLESGAASASTRTGWYRSVFNIPHQFAISSFLDELAHAAHRDPRAFLLENLGPDRVIDMEHVGLAGKASDYGSYDEYPVDTGRFRRVLELVTAQSGWGSPLPRGQARGLAVVRASLSYLASVVQIVAHADGTVRIPRVDIAVDAGTIVNRDRVRAQMEGGTIMGLGNALVGEISFARGRAEQSNFHNYQVLRLDAAPREIHVHIVPSTEPPGGVGEPAVAPTLPALCNAIFAATGRRIRTLPVKGQMGANA